MNSTNNHSETAPPASGRPCASPAEVRDFLLRMKTRTPDEVLGTEANRGLAMALAWSTLACVLVFVAFTAGPIILRKPAAEARPEVKQPSEKEAVGPVPEPVEKPGATPAPPAPALVKDKPRPPAGKDFLDKIGATTTKTASPKVNPLEKSVDADDLLKDLDKK